MPFIITIVLLIAIVLFVVLRISLRKKQLTVQQFFSLYLVGLVALALTYLGLSGKLHPLFALFGGLIPLITNSIKGGSGLFRGYGLWRQFSHLFTGSNAPSNQSSQSGSAKQTSVQTLYLDVELDHDSGTMTGKILLGTFENRQLESLSQAELSQLIGEVKTDPDSNNILNAFIERNHPDWDFDNATPDTATSLDIREALGVLGLDEAASRDDIIDAHRRLIQKMHPDRGGSTVLAARINEAKDVLLKYKNYDA
jgi:hypothetical protein